MSQRQADQAHVEAIALIASARQSCVEAKYAVQERRPPERTALGGPLTDRQLDALADWNAAIGLFHDQLRPYRDELKRFDATGDGDGTFWDEPFHDLSYLSTLPADADDLPTLALSLDTLGDWQSVTVEVEVDGTDEYGKADTDRQVVPAYLPVAACRDANWRLDDALERLGMMADVQAVEREQRIRPQR